MASRPLAASATTSSVGLLVDDVGDAGPQQRVVVDDEHARARVALATPARSPPASQRPACSALGIENDAGCHASTTSVPARGAVTKVSEAPMRSARSRMLVMPKPRRCDRR